MTYLVLDLETSCQEKHGRKGNPFFNRILTIGLKYQNKEAVALAQDYMPKGWLDGVEVLIGHNIKYDLLYIWNNPDLQEAFKSGLRIFDTQLTEYIISGQQHKYPALREIAVNKYECPERIKHIEQGFEQGLDTTQLDINLLLEDVRNDVLDTEQVALKQLQIVHNEQMSALIKGQMDSLLATTEMEFNGMYVNQCKLKENKEKLIEFKEENLTNLNKIVRKYWPNLLQFNSSSPQQLSILLFGGTIKYVSKEPIGLFKTGKNKGETKYRNVERELKIDGCKVKPESSWAGQKAGIYSTDEAVLQIISQERAKYSADAVQICNILLNIRDINKQLNTYYTATEEYIHDFDSCVHTQLCHCGYERIEGQFGGGTSTGRLSSRAPNMQNQPKATVSKAKEHFTSRYKSGCLVELDYSQLELRVFAFLTQDKKLIHDIENGVDIHKETAALALNKNLDEVTDLERSNAKKINFGLIYGSGAYSMASRNNLDKDFCQLFIDTFFKRYPQTKQWQTNILKKVNESKVLDPLEKTKKGQAQHVGIYRSVTGRKCVFRTQDSPLFMARDGKVTSFNPPDIKNYPVQSLATADIVLIMLGRVWRKLALDNKEFYLLVNTVHDSIILDMKFYCKDQITMIQLELEKVSEMMKELFDVNFNVPIKVDVKYGNSWMMTK